MAPHPDDEPPGRADEARTTPDEARTVPARTPRTPDTPDRSAPSPVNAALDGYFWERRRLRAVVPVTVGVLGLTALGLVQELPVRHTVERDLTDRSAQALATAGVDGVRVRFEGRDGTVTGTVADRADRDSAMSAVRQVRGVRVAHDRLAGPGGPTSRPGTPNTPNTPNPPSTLSTPDRTPIAAPKAAPHLTVELHDGRLTLAGEVPSAQQRAQVVAAARTAVHPQRVSSRISIDPALSGAGLDALPRVLRALGPDASVSVDLRGGRLALTGGVASDRQRRQALAAGAAVTGDPALVVDRLSVDPRVTVAAALRTLPPVTFRTAYSTPTDADKAVLRRLAAVLRANPAVRLQVQGHTDDVGAPDMNYGLSYARARTVYQELQRLGVPRAQLSFRAYGERDPKLPNTSADNRAANRRVEFAVQR